MTVTRQSAPRELTNCYSIVHDNLNIVHLTYNECDTIDSVSGFRFKVSGFRLRISSLEP